MSTLIPSAGSSQVLTCKASVTQPDQDAPVHPTSHDPDVQSFSFSRQLQGKRRDACSNPSLYGRTWSLACGVVRWDPIWTIWLPACTNKGMPRAVYRAIYAPVIRSAAGCIDKAILSATLTTPSSRAMV